MSHGSTRYTLAPIRTGTAAQVHLNRIKVLQNRALRFISFSPIDTPMLPLYSRFNVLPLQKLLQLQQASFMFNFHNNSLPINFRKYCEKPTHKHNTRLSQSNFVLPPLCTKTSHKSIKVIGPQIWANVSPELKSLQFRKSFSKRFKKHLLSELPCPKPYKSKFDKKDSRKNLSILRLFQEDDDDSTFYGFDLSLRVIFNIDDNDDTFYGFDLSLNTIFNEDEKDNTFHGF